MQATFEGTTAGTHMNVMFALDRSGIARHAEDLMTPAKICAATSAIRSALRHIQVLGVVMTRRSVHYGQPHMGMKFYHS